MSDLDEIKAAFLRGEQPVIDGEPVQVADDYNSVARELFWMHKNLPVTRACLEAGIAFCKSQPASEELLGKEKALNYNLASFSWPGWGEENIAPTDDDVRAGEQAANRNLELAIELKRGPAPMTNAHWLIGAYHLHFNRRESAVAEFQKAEASSTDDAAKLLMRGYRELADFDDKGFEQSCKLMETVGGDDAEFYNRQLQVAWWIYNFSDEAA